MPYPSWLWMMKVNSQRQLQRWLGGLLGSWAALAAPAAAAQPQVLLAAPESQPQPDDSAGASRRYRLESSELVVLDKSGEEELARLELAEPGRTLLASGDVVYVAKQSFGVLLIDVADPAHPRALRTFAEELSVGELQTEGTLLRLRGLGGRHYAWYGIAAPRSPIFLRRLDLPSPPPGSGDRPAPTGNPAIQREVWRQLGLRDGSQLGGHPTTLASGKFLTLCLPGDALLTLASADVSSQRDREFQAGELAEGAGPNATALGEVELAALAPRGELSDRVELRVEERRLTVLRRAGMQHMVLGELTLPWPATSRRPLLLGRAAYVILSDGGVAVVDFGLLRFPYVAWRLAPASHITTFELAGTSLLLHARGVSRSFAVADPLRPQGDASQAWLPVRVYEDEAPLRSDARWQEPQRRWLSPLRRLYLRSGQVTVGELLAVGPSRVTLFSRPWPPVSFPTADIRHIEPVDPAAVAIGPQVGLSAGQLVPPARQPVYPRSSKAGLIAGLTIGGLLLVGAVVGFAAYLASRNVQFFPSY